MCVSSNEFRERRSAAGFCYVALVPSRLYKFHHSHLLVSSRRRNILSVPFLEHPVQDEHGPLQRGRLERLADRAKSVRASSYLARRCLASFLASHSLPALAILSFHSECSRALGYQDGLISVYAIYAQTARKRWRDSENASQHSKHANSK